MVNGLNPTSGPSSGGNPVFITGSGFTGVTRVRFGTANAAFIFNSDTRITATAPPAVTLTPVNVTVTTPRGTSRQGVLYSYVSSGTAGVTSVDPDVGPFEGSNTVTVNGTGLAMVTSVWFGTASALAFTVISDSEITATVPPGTGIVDVSVNAPCGSPGAGTCGTYTYMGVPSVDSLVPDHGPAAGSNSVVINGSNLTDVDTVLFGDTIVPFVVISDSQITAIAPPGTGTVLVAVSNRLASSSPAVPYTYD
ncbi:IPT/TIG domain-containing protein [Actinomadura sp. WMMA1423]|uniref:IPT/TIG domain-containing protein n=1 Tax=Actinomadura sp. WMMA1423 TaxID=2591108 RepID=UPI00143CFDED|nr:IPT/TIG domain-containing protein [Actinomadura sp. WMMA1423]